MSVDDEKRPDLNRYPPGFETWPRQDQVLKVDDRYRREGIIADIFESIGYDVDRDIGTDTKLRKEELVAIKCALEGRPIEMGDVDKFHRRGIIQEILCLTGYSTHEGGVGDESRLTTKELAAVYLTVEGIGHDG